MIQGGFVRVGILIWVILFFVVSFLGVEYVQIMVYVGFKVEERYGSSNFIWILWGLCGV